MHDLFLASPLPHALPPLTTLCRVQILQAFKMQDKAELACAEVMMSAWVFVVLIAQRPHAGIILNPHPDVCVMLNELFISCVCSTGRPPPSGQYLIPG